MIGWYHWLSGHEFEQAPRNGEGQGSQMCCSLWGPKESDTTEWLNNNSSAWKIRHSMQIFKTNKERFPPALLLAAAAAKSHQSCPTLCNPIDGSPPGFSVPGILQARTLEWVVISFSNAEKWKANVKSLSCVRLVVTPWTAAYQAPLPMGFSRQEYWSGLPLPSPRF